MLRRINQHPSGKEESCEGRLILGLGDLPLNHLTLDAVEKGLLSSTDTRHESTQQSPQRRLSSNSSQTQTPGPGFSLLNPTFICNVYIPTAGFG